MTVQQLASQLALPIIETAEEDREITGVYCGDLLSVVMSSAPADSAWVTIIGNANAVAVAMLAEISCVVLAEGKSFDPAAVAAAKGKVTLLTSNQPIYETAVKIGKLL